MDKLRLLTAVLFCGLLSVPALAAPGVYTVDFTVGDNATGLETVVGTIDLRPGTHGAITPSEILSWTLTGPFCSSCLLISPGGPVSGGFAMVSGQVMATRAHGGPKTAISATRVTEAVSSVPEPGTFCLLAFALAGLAIARIRGGGWLRSQFSRSP